MNAGPVGMVDSLEGVAARATEPDWPQLGRYRDANRALEGIPQKLVFIGDSITEMWPAADPALFGTGIVNRGISGQTTPQTLLRFIAHVVRRRPHPVHPMAGNHAHHRNPAP